MTGLNLDPIRARMERCDEATGSTTFSLHSWSEAVLGSAQDVPALIVEVERLAALLDSEKTHCAQISEWNGEIKTERDELALAVIKQEADLRDHAAALDACRRSRAEIRTQRDEALQVIRDLRGGSGG